MNFVTACCLLPGIKAVLDLFNQVNLGQAIFKIQNAARDGYIRSRCLQIYIVFKRAVKMSDFSLSLEDIAS